MQVTEEIKELLQCGVDSVQCEARWRDRPWRLGLLRLTPESQFVFLYTTRRGTQRQRSLFVDGGETCWLQWHLF